MIPKYLKTTSNKWFLWFGIPIQRLDECTLGVRVMRLFRVLCIRYSELFVLPADLSRVFLPPSFDVFGEICFCNENFLRFARSVSVENTVFVRHELFLCLGFDWGKSFYSFGIQTLNYSGSIKIWFSQYLLFSNRN